MPLSMANSGGKCSSPHCVLTPYALRTNTEVDVRGELASQSRWYTSNREVSDAAERAPAFPKVCPIIPMYSQYYFPLHSPQI